MTSAYLLEVAVFSNYDVSNISRQQDGSAIVTSSYLLKMQKTKKRGEPAVARSVVTKKRQQLSEQLLNNLLEHIQLLGRNQRSKWKESMADIESCKFLKSMGQDLYYSGK
ncbi:hypothetical protein F511_09932 [Dorcoceras hygrometricum]|uniref:Uncharacterized protein n=1 Tax=Dorcoceras hygrometricum TaxID=472368 RepID=A0A2Z7CNF6_9LAMI|nr:hypothetical protein F511_09932 [Dorcoceras hygrometricum]